MGLSLVDEEPDPIKRDAAWRAILPNDDFRKLVTDYEARLEALLEKRGWPKKMISDLSPLLFFPLFSPYEHLYVGHPGELLRHKTDRWLQDVLLPHDLVYIGCCGNGDFLAVKVADGSVVLVSHEEFDYRDLSNLEQITRTIAGSVSEYVIAVHRKKAPLDYYDNRKTRTASEKKSSGTGNRRTGDATSL